MGKRRAGARRQGAADAAPAATAPNESSRSARSKPTKQSRSRKGAGSWLSRLAYWTLVLGIWTGLAGIAVVVLAASTLPPIQLLEVPKRPPTVDIVGIDGKPLTARGEMTGTDVSIKELPPYLPRAFVAIEDRRFFSHFGVDPIGLARAVVANVLHRGVAQGGSTLSQQLAKNLFLTQERTVWRKLQELVLAIWLERKFSKQEILELYLNRVYFGSGAYGVEAAAQRYFGKPARQVKVAEAAMLAGLVKSPSRLAPNRNPQGAERRAQAVIASMSELGFITETMAKTALAQPARALRPAGAGSINYVADWVMDALDDLIGRVDQDLVVETSIDPLLQAAAEKALTEELAAKGAKFDVSQGAVVAMSLDGAVRALIGGKSYNESQYNRAVTARRQPGSAFKPFVYLTALERGLTPESVRDDKPLALKGWKPENYTRDYHGPVSLTQALAHSLNTVAVRLTLEVGAPAVAKTAYRLGITSKLEPNASLALGTSEVSLIELVSAYAPFANGGDFIAPHVIERVRTHGSNNNGGKVLFARATQTYGRIIEPRQVAMMNAMLRETIVSGTGQKAQLPGWQAAGKTGTTQDFRDAWFIGYTGHLVTGVWLGNDDSSSMKKLTGGGLPAEIWSRVMKAAHQGVPVAALPGLASMPTFAAAGPPSLFPLPALPPLSPSAPLPPAASSAHPPSPPSPAPTPFASAPPPAPRFSTGSTARPAPINSGTDNSFMERLFGRR